MSSSEARVLELQECPFAATSSNVLNMRHVSAFVDLAAFTVLLVLLLP